MERPPIPHSPKESLEFTLNTLWVFPTPVFQRIAKAFLALSFPCTCYDEGESFVGDGFFNPNTFGPEFAIGEPPTNYERVYGNAPSVDDED